MHPNRWASNQQQQQQQDFFASKQDCHVKTEKVFEDWDQCLKSLTTSKNLDVHEETQKSAKLFTQVDSISRNTKLALEKTEDILDKLLDKKLGILGSTKSFNEVQSLLDLNPVVKAHWQSTFTE